MATQVGKLNYSDNKNTILGKGSYGTVFPGTYGPDRTPVAVKRIEKVWVDKEFFNKEVDLMKKVRYHPNILRLIHTEDNDVHFL